jgi:hypothetical protein
MHRFSAHLVPGGLLFLVLPRRWICVCACLSAQAHSENTNRATSRDSDSRETNLTRNAVVSQKSVDVSFAAFELMLNTIGFVEVAERRVTPKLVFFTLEKAHSNREESTTESTAWKLKASASASKWGSLIPELSIAKLNSCVSSFIERHEIAPFCTCPFVPQADDSSQCSAYISNSNRKRKHSESQRGSNAIASRRCGQCSRCGPLATLPAYFPLPIQGAGTGCDPLFGWTVV